LYTSRYAAARGAIAIIAAFSDLEKKAPMEYFSLRLDLSHRDFTKQKVLADSSPMIIDKEQFAIVILKK